jgi:GMP synthase (glutamine-hydrolysing)
MSRNPRQAIALKHVPFEDLGSLQPVLESRGFRIQTLDAFHAHREQALISASDLLVVMGGPIGVYEHEAFPFLCDEIRAIRTRLEAHQPVLGICLGAQLLAAALGARVYPGAAGVEIGWKTIQAAGAVIPSWFMPLLKDDLKVLHWHGDTFDLPQGAQWLAKTDIYDSQAFRIGKHALALQFHPEVTAEGLERWYIGHAAELSQKKISVTTLRDEGERHAAELAEPARRFWELWLDYIL